ncbi:MAG: aspartyl-tRNA synthetase [Blastocatellia bacterium]|nr:aspartyl-tRNA synthetase [Blastocatellia bacterium]
MLDDLGNLERTHSCGELRSTNIGETVVLMGWVARRRDHGPLTFVDLRDRDGVTQVVFNEETAPEAHAKAKELRGEYVIAVTGEVVPRDESQHNPKLATGEIEVQARELLILNDAKTLPFKLETVGVSNGLAGEDLRLKYRYLDLRRPQLQANLRLRHRMLQQIRSYMSENSFTEIETPILIKSTPEGARDYIVPSRIQPGKFFALPQSPQLFKQLCMIAGLDKYFQIARCFRDEDLRADRQPEFTQLDVELSFATTEQIYRLIEGLFVRIFRLIDVELPTPFLRLPYAEAMARYGSDKPDLRFEMELRDLSPAVRGTTFPPFASTLESGGQIKGITVKGAAGISRKTLDELQEFVKRYGAGALAWIKIGDELSSSLLKTLGEDTVLKIAELAHAQTGDAVLIVAGRAKTVAASLGALRNEVARREKLIPENTFRPLWVTEFPMFEFNEGDGRYYAMHHPFTSPLDEDLPAFTRAVEGGETELFGTLRAKAYDAVINGVEVAGGSIRIHRNDVQRLVFKALGISPETARERFGFFLDALEFGTPPHGGIASGIERTMMVLANTENIRDVMAFPKTASATDLMIEAPGDVDEAQLRELRIKIVKD